MNLSLPCLVLAYNLPLLSIVLRMKQRLLSTALIWLPFAQCVILTTGLFLPLHSLLSRGLGAAAPSAWNTVPLLLTLQRSQF